MSEHLRQRSISLLRYSATPLRNAAFIVCNSDGKCSNQACGNVKLNESSKLALSLSLVNWSWIIFCFSSQFLPPLSFGRGIRAAQFHCQHPARKGWRSNFHFTFLRVSRYWRGFLWLGHTSAPFYFHPFNSGYWQLQSSNYLSHCFTGC